MSTRRDTPLERNGADFTASWVRHPNHQVLQRAKTRKDDAHCSPQANPNFVPSAAPDLPQDLPEYLKKRHQPDQEEMYIGNIRVPPSMRPERERGREVEEGPKKRCSFSRKTLHSILAVLAAAGAAYLITQASTHYAVDAAAETQHAALPPAAAVPVARSLGESLKAAQTSEQKDPEPSPVASPSQPNLLDPKASPHRPASPTGASPPSSDVALAKTAVRLPEMPKVEDAATTAAASAPIPSATELDKETIALFIKRGEQFIDAGDFASARVVLRRAAEAGDRKAALAMAGTYDPAALKRLGVKGMAPDPERARYWYQKARSLGSPEAPNLLKQLANRTK